MKIQSTTIHAIGCCLLFAAMPAFAHAGAPFTNRADRAATPTFLTTLIERQLAEAPIEGAALETIYRAEVRSPEDASTFFYSATFLRLDLAGQRRVIDAALRIDPASFVRQTGFLPVSLRAEYQGKALAATREIELRRLARLSLEDQIRLYLPSHDGMRGSELGAEAFDRAGQVRRFLRDPALRHLGAVENSWIAELPAPLLTAEALIEAKVLVARNLERRGLPPSRANAALVWEELEAARAELADLRLFSGRHVVFAAGKDPQELPNFGKATTLAALREQGPASLELLRSGDRGASASLAAAIARDGELTLVLETHGRADALEFDGALKADELAAMFAGRHGQGRAIVIVNACFGHDFARAFAERLRSRGLPAPILIVPEEFGQVTLVGRQESSFTRDELGLGKRAVSTLRDLWPGNYRETAVYAQLAQGLAQLR